MMGYVLKETLGRLKSQNIDVRLESLNLVLKLSAAEHYQNSFTAFSAYPI
jgi:hypothetical protein